MIRPLIQSIYDYRMTFSQQNSISTRNSFKPQFCESCYFVAADHMLSSLQQPGQNLESVINSWNNKNTQVNKDRKQVKLDYKSRLDDLFKGAGKSYYRREYERTLSRQKSDDYKDSRYSGDRLYSRNKDYGYSYNSSSKYEPSYHKGENHPSKYRNDRY